MCEKKICTKPEECYILKYDGVTPEIIKEKINSFESLDTRSMSDYELSKAIFDVLSFNDETMIISTLRELHIKTPFYRVRKIRSDFSNFDKKSDFWEPPAHAIKKMERLNQPGEPLLYVSSNYPTAIDECRIKEEEWFALIRYESCAPIQINWIGGPTNYSKLNISDKRIIEIHDLYNSFLVREFSRNIKEGEEFLYRISEKIAKEYFVLEKQDAWMYCSVAAKRDSNAIGYNICFEPDKAHKLLKLTGALICCMERSKNFNIQFFFRPKQNTDGIEHCEINKSSSWLKDYFPEIVEHRIG